MSESYKVYASQEYVDNRLNDVSGLPSGSKPNQYIVTDGDGNAKWEDKLCWSGKAYADMTWDGVVPDGETLPYTYKAGEAINPPDLMGATIEIYFKPTGDTRSYIIGQDAPFERIDTSVDGFYFCNLLTLATKPAELEDVSFPEAGIYFTRNEDGYPTRLSFPETIHPIDKKYLPSSLGRDWYYYQTPDCVLYKDESLTDAVTIADMEDVLSCGKFREVYDGGVGGDIRFAGGAFFNANRTKGFKVSAINVYSDGTISALELKSSDYKAASPR